MQYAPTQWQKIMKTITKLLLFTAVIFTASSCATLFSRSGYNAFFYTDTPNTSLRINDSEIQPIPSKIRLAHSNRNLNVQVLQNDSIVNETFLVPRFGNPAMAINYFFPPGFIVDFATGRGFTYGEFFAVDSLGKITRLRQPNQYMRENLIPVRDRTIRQHQQGDFNLQIALPYTNFFHLKPRNETPRNMWGFFGLGLGLEYFYRNNRSLQLRGDAMIDFPLPLPASIHPEGHWETASSLNLNLTDNFHINRFRLGYGLNFARNIWNYQGYEMPPRWEREPDDEFIWIPSRRSTNNMLGLALSTHYRFTNRFYLGVIYRPSFWELSRNRLMYEHTISVDFMWKIRF